MPVCDFLCLLVFHDKKNWTQKFESLRYISQAYHVVHQPVSRGLAVFADAWLSDWLAEISADLRENGSALEVVPWRCAIQIHDFTYFTLLPGGDNRMILRSLVLTQYQRVTDGQKDTPTSIIRSLWNAQGRCNLLTYYIKNRTQYRAWAYWRAILNNFIHQTAGRNSKQ